MLGRGDQPFLSANSPVVLETPRALLRLWEEHDLPELQAICSDPEVMRFVGTGEPWSVDRTRQFMVLSEQRFRQYGYCQWAVVNRDNSAVAGFCGFIPDRDGGVEMGWRLGRGFWGRGLATEVARAALHYAFTELQVPFVVATVQTGNQASFRVAEKLGFTPGETFERYGRETWRLQRLAPAPGRES